MAYLFVRKDGTLPDELNPTLWKNRMHPNSLNNITPVNNLHRKGIQIPDSSVLLFDAMELRKWVLRNWVIGCGAGRYHVRASRKGVNGSESMMSHTFTEEDVEAERKRQEKKKQKMPKPERTPLRQPQVIYELERRRIRNVSELVL